jgi:hypothetical protein
VNVGRIVGCLALAVVVVFTCACSLLDAGTDRGELDGYLLHRKAMRHGPSEGYMFVQFVPDKSVGMKGQIIGRMHTAFPSPTDYGMPSVQLDSYNITGTVNDTDVMIEQQWSEPGNVVGPMATYSGTIEDNEMRLTTNVQGILTVWEGDKATLEDFGAAAEELATA